jgi:hypothetical protein
MEQIDARQELVFIKKVIQDSRTAVVDNGIEYIVWGALVALGMFGTVALVRLGAAGGRVTLALWAGIMGVGWAFSLIRHHRHRRRAPAETLAGRLLGAIWLGCGVAIMLFLFVHGPVRHADPCPPIAAVLGIGFFLSGMLMDFMPLRWSGICWWLGSAALLFLRPMTAELLFFGLMMIVFQVVPGVILYRKWKRSHTDAG